MPKYEKRRQAFSARRTSAREVHRAVRWGRAEKARHHRSTTTPSLARAAARAMLCLLLRSTTTHPRPARASSVASGFFPSTLRPCCQVSRTTSHTPPCRSSAPRHRERFACSS